MKKTEKRITSEAEPLDAVADLPYIDYEYCGVLDDLWQQIKGRFESYEQSRSLVDPYFYQCLAFFSGRHYMRWNPTLNCLDPILPVNPLYTQAVSNLILPHCRGLIAKLLKPKPNAQVLPNSGSDDDRLGALAGRKLLRHNYYNGGYEAEYAEAAAHIVIEGIGAIKTLWDHYGGRAYVKHELEPVMRTVMMEAQKEGQEFGVELDEHLRDPKGEINEREPESAEGGPKSGTPEEDTEPSGTPENGEANEPGPEEGASPAQPAGPRLIPVEVPALDEQNKPIMRPRTDDQGNPIVLDEWFEGKVVKTAVSPFSLYYDMTVKKFRDLFDIVEVNYKSLDYIKNNIPNCQDLDESDCEQNNVSPWENIFSMQIDQSYMQVKTGLRVYEFYCKSCEDFPKGLQVIIVKDKIRAAGPMDTLEGEELPYSFGKYIQLPGALRGMSIVEFLMGPQSLRNKLLSQHVENAKLAETYRILTRNGGKFNDIVTTQTGVLISYTGQDTPTIMPMPQLPSTHMQLIELMQKDMEFIAMQSATSFGFIPNNITSGDMLEGATENNYQAHFQDMETFANMIAHSCHLELLYEQHNRKSEIMIRYLGENGKLETDAFQAAILRNNVDVICLPGDVGNDSRQAQSKGIETLMPAIVNGQVDPVQAKLVVGKAVEGIFTGDEAFVIDQMNKDVNAARFMIDQIKQNAGRQGYEPVIMPYDKIEVWREEIRLKLTDRQEMSRWPGVARDMLFQFYQEVVDRVDKAQQSANAVPGEGAPGPGGPQGPPPSVKPGGPPAAPPARVPGNVPAPPLTPMPGAQ